MRLGLRWIEVYVGHSPFEFDYDIPAVPFRIEGHACRHIVRQRIPLVTVSAFPVRVPLIESISGPYWFAHRTYRTSGHGHVNDRTGTVHVIQCDRIHVTRVQIHVPGDRECECERVVERRIGIPADEVLIGRRTVGECDGRPVLVIVLQLSAFVDMERDAHVRGLRDLDRQRERNHIGAAVHDAHSQIVLFLARTRE